MIDLSKRMTWLNPQPQLNTISSDSPRQEVQAKSKATQYTKIFCFVIWRYLLHSQDMGQSLTKAYFSEESQPDFTILNFM